MSTPDANGWLPIEYCPVTDEASDAILVVWVKHGGLRGTGSAAFARKFKEGTIRAAGHHGDWECTHFQIMKPPVQP